MGTKFVSERNLKFLLHEVFDVESLTAYEYYQEHNPKTFDMVLKAAIKLGKDLLYPIFEEMDRQQPELVNGEVKVHADVGKIMQEFGDGRWISSRVPFDRDGEQLPNLVADMCDFVFACANCSAYAYPNLTYGASHLIESFGSKELADTYIPKMRSGNWQGTMALTEPEAGSSLSDIATMAEPTAEGHYRIKGQKIFISADDHDGAENIIHLMLAKIEGAPAGVRGISLFVVPKKRVDDNGDLVSNDVATSGVYHKLGHRGCPIVQLSMGDKDDCRGWLVGEPHNGLKYMFQMMNEARIQVGMGIISISQGLQCLGGSGYCDDYSLEQYYRDCRIHPIHEGTTGIQGMDLLGRKVIMDNGRAFLLYINEIEDTIGAAQQYGELRGFANDLNTTLTDLQDVTQQLITIAQQQGPEVFLADATLYLEFFSIVTIAWQWLLQGVAVQRALKNGAKKTDQTFYQGKMFTLRYFFAYELPKTLGLARRLLDDDRLTVEMGADYFND